jgi:hypothetical protein
MDTTVKGPLVVCVRCLSFFLEDRQVPAQEAATGGTICENCYLPIVIRFNQHEIDLIPDEDMECDCNPIYESDTDSWIHDEDCQGEIFYHLDGTIYQMNQLFSAYPAVQDDFLKDRE